MKKVILLLTIAFLGLSTVNAQQIDLGNAAYSSLCGASSLGTGSGSTGSGFIQENNVSADAGFIVEADKDFDKIRFRYAANSTSGGTPLDGVYKITVHNDNNCSSSFPVSGTSYTFPHTGGWSTWEEITLNVSGSEGEYIHVRPTNSTGGINPDWVEFASTIDLGDPANSKTCGASVIATNASGYTGMGFRANNNQSVDAGFIVQADKKFSKIRFRYAAASGGGSSDGVYNISVQTHDDCNTSGPDFVFPATGGWSTWEEVTFNISGNEGEYLHLRRGNSTGGMNPDWIEFVPSHKIWTGTQNTDWNNANNWISGVVPSASADITISTGLVNYPEIEANVTVNDIEIETGATLSIKSGQSLTVEGTLTNHGTVTVESGGALVQETGSTLAGSGIYNVQRAISGPQTFIGSPINNQSVGGFGITATGTDGGQVEPDGSNPCNPDSVDAGSPYGNILELREDVSPISNCGQSLWHVKSTGSLENGRGYAVNSNATTLDFSGTVNNGTVTYTGLTRQSGTIGTQDGSTSSRGWHLVSNPYPSPIELSGADLTAMGFDNQIHRYNPATGNWVSNDPLVTATIAVGQGFQIRKTSVGGSADFELDNSHRVSGNPTFYKQSNPRDAYLDISLDGNGQADQSMVYFYEDATANYDPLYDANKLMGTYSNPMLYTEADNERLSYNAYAPLNPGEQRTVPLSLHAGTDGSFNLSFEAVTSLNDQDISVTLEDLKLDTSIILSEGYSYSFDASNSEANERFLLHFNKAEEQEEEEVVSNIVQIAQDGISLYPNPTEGNISLHLNQDHSYNTAVVYDITGKEKARLTISGQTDSYRIQTAGLSNGVYFLQLSGSESNSTLKFIKQ